MTIFPPVHAMGGSLAAALVLLTGCAWAQPAPTLTTLVGGLDDPNGLVVGSGGVLYGTTYYGGSVGQVYSLTPPATSGAPWTYTVLYSFTNGNDGAYPHANVTIGGNGVLYGTTGQGGGHPEGSPGCGTVYQLMPPASANGSWTETVIYRFVNAGCGHPTGGVAIGVGGVLYGSSGDALYSLSPPASPGADWTYTALYTFTGGSDGGEPGGLLIGSGGVLFGTTNAGGTGSGTVFALTPPAAPDSTWSLEVLYSFVRGRNVTGPPPVVIGEHGVLYGTMSQGGTPNTACSLENEGCGIVFALVPPDSPGGSWVYRTLYNFTGGSDGYEPSGIVIGRNGKLIGAAYLGGAFTYFGTIFSLTPPESPGGSWTESTLYSFTGYPNASNPEAGVVFGAGGALYGTGQNYAGCQNSCGGVFSLTR
jgi:hypothetical protein